MTPAGIVERLDPRVAAFICRSVPMGQHHQRHLGLSSGGFLLLHGLDADAGSPGCRPRRPPRPACRPRSSADSRRSPSSIEQPRSDSSPGWNARCGTRFSGSVVRRARHIDDIGDHRRRRRQGAGTGAVVKRRARPRRHTPAPRSSRHRRWRSGGAPGSAWMHAQFDPPLGAPGPRPGA